MARGPLAANVAGPAYAPVELAQEGPTLLEVWGLLGTVRHIA